MKQTFTRKSTLASLPTKLYALLAMMLFAVAPTYAQYCASTHYYGCGYNSNFYYAAIEEVSFHQNGKELWRKSPDGCVDYQNAWNTGSHYHQITSTPTFTLAYGSDFQIHTGLNASTNLSFLWSTGDTTASITAYESGIYSVEVSDIICPFFETDEVEIVSLTDGGSYWVPNAFTPNKDDLNEGFIPFREFDNIISYEFMVFTRWGEIIFHTFDRNAAWDGKIDGVEAPSETYFWFTRILAECLDDDQFYQKGTVQLLR